MAERNKAKESTPPPLLLMPASQGLTFDANEGLNILMPVPQTEASLMSPEEDGEVDSFLGQVQPALNPLGGFQAQASTVQVSSVQQGVPPPTSQVPANNMTHQLLQSGSVPAPGGVPFSSAVSAPPPPPGGMAMPVTAPPTGPAQNYRRMPGRPQYAQPPPGTYAPPNQSQADSKPFAPSFPEQNTPGLINQVTGATSPAMMMPSSHAELAANYPTAPPVASSTPNPGVVSPISSGPAVTSPGSVMSYTPLQHHWFYSKHIELRQVWEPFSMIDSNRLEEAYSCVAQDQMIVSTDGGRYDVDLTKRTRVAIYWDEAVTYVRRCSWFYRQEGSSRLMPFEEDIADRLENIYKETLRTNDWHRRHELPNGEVIVMHSPNVFVNFSAAAQPDEWGNTQSDVRPRVVKRGIDEVEDIPEGEPTQIDHLVLVVHGIGSTCDLRFRNIIECVDDFRKMSLNITRSHFKTYQEEGRIGRVEYLPVRWHQALHGDATGVDRRLKAITLSSIGKLRHYTNDTLLDILFYTSPKYAQQIADTVGNELKRLYELFVKRNPGFKGAVSVAGHSLGALILFDLLTHQISPVTPNDVKPFTSSSSVASPSGDSYEQNSGNDSSCLTETKDDSSKSDDNSGSQDNAELSSSTNMSDSQCSQDPLLRSVSSTSVQYMIGVAGTGVPCVKYPQLNFSPVNFFALGSPIAMFLTVRGVEMLGEEFHFPTCPGFFNIFHPFDPVAYRLEPMITPMYPPKPFLMPHHKGRKRLHLELKENLARVGSDLKQKMISYFKATWKTLNEFALAHRSNLNEALEQEIDNVMSQVEDENAETASIVSSVQDETYIGSLNQGRRIDYVLQEKPIESFNDYLFALGSHGCYWESEDTVLLILKEVYALMGMAPIKPGLEHTISATRPAYPMFPRHPMGQSMTATPPPTSMRSAASAPYSAPPSMGTAQPVMAPGPPPMNSMSAPPLGTTSPKQPPVQTIHPAGSSQYMANLPPIDSASFGIAPQQNIPGSNAVLTNTAVPPSEIVGAPPLTGFVPK